MAYYRGNGRPSNSSNAEDNLYNLLLRAYNSGKLREMPLWGVDAEYFLETEGGGFVAKPDFRFPESMLIVQLDGPHHLKRRSEVRDRIVDSYWEDIGYQVLRFSYNPRLGRRKQFEIMEKLVEAVQ